MMDFRNCEIRVESLQTGRLISLDHENHREKLVDHQIREGLENRFVLRSSTHMAVRLQSQGPKGERTHLAFSLGPIYH